ncbi:ABC transporter substrate-binding protein [Rhizobium leguminosarum bv. viciae]|nr:ABC transporter substrate-binding protein [Rhizobium leguminosarum bv. viciae]
MTKTPLNFRRRDFLKAAATTSVAVAGFPYIARADANPIRIGMTTILSGRVAMLGNTARAGASLIFDAVNEAGGINGRKIELVVRDSEGKPDVAAKLTRDLINSDGCEIILSGESSAGSFAVQEVIRSLPVLCVHSETETSSLTADPKLFVKTAFRACRQGIHDAVVGGTYAAKIAKEKGLKRWVTCSPDYAFGRDNTAQFMELLKQYEPSVEFIDQTWPKLYAPDYTESITKILSQQPQAVYSALWGGDLVAFVEQANLYRLFDNTTMFSTAIGDTPVLTAIKQLPEGIHSAYRYSRKSPDTQDNREFADAFKKIVGHDPTGWGWEANVGAAFIVEALKRTNGKTDGATLASEMEDMTIKSPLGVNGEITMRGSDHTIINYPVAWSRTVRTAPYLDDFVSVDWSVILDFEKEWKKAKGYN